MSSLVFVHGIGVRAPAGGGEHPYDATCRAIRYELAFKQIGWKLVECRWGDDLGAKLLGDGKSIPKLAGQLAVAAQPDDPAALWMLLLNDPFFELRALAAMQADAPAAASGGPPGQKPAWVVLQERLAGLKPAGDLAARLKAFELEASFAAAVKQVQANPATKDAMRHPQAARAIARAVAVLTLAIGYEHGIPPPSLPDIEAIATDTEHLLRQAQLSVLGDWAKSAVLGLGTSWGVTQRAMLADRTSPAGGDVLYYQAHGDRIRARIHKTVADAPEPVAIMAHSLGGIASFEAMCENERTRKRVKKFITAGSQSGFFYELDSLRTLDFEQPLPADFPDWLNFFDARDFLSFVVKDVFKGGGARTDVEIKSGLPFPASHSGYWRQPVTWEKLKAFLAD